MGRNPCSLKDGFRKGAWTASEDKILLDYVKAHGEGKWSRISKETGLKRCGKSCRLRWMNYLRPDIKRGNISSDEEELIIRLHKLLGNRWSLIAGRLPGRTDNEIKNYWNTNLAKKVSEVQLSHFRGFGCGSASVATHSTKDPIPPQEITPQGNDAPDLNNNRVTEHGLIKAVASDFNYGSPSLSLNSTRDFMVDFNLNDEDIRQILESGFSGINQDCIDNLLSPEPELEIGDYLSMFEEQDFQSRLSSGFLSADETAENGCLNNGGGGDDECMIGSEFVPVFESGHKKWPKLDLEDDDLNII